MLEENSSWHRRPSFHVQHMTGLSNAILVSSPSSHRYTVLPNKMKRSVDLRRARLQLAYLATRKQLLLATLQPKYCCTILWQYIHSALVIVTHARATHRLRRHAG
jgi:hypothetical protein